MLSMLFFAQFISSVYEAGVLIFPLSARPPCLKTDWHLLESFRIAGRLQHVTRAAEQLGTASRR